MCVNLFNGFSSGRSSRSSSSSGSSSDDDDSDDDSLWGTKNNRPHLAIMLDDDPVWPSEWRGSIFDAAAAASNQDVPLKLCNSFDDQAFAWEAQDRLVMVAKLGSGASGSVFKAVDVDTLQLVAVKLIHFNSRDMKSARLIRREVAALSSQSAPMLLQTFGAGMTPCPYISHFYGVKYDKARMQASIAMEYACCGSLEAWTKDGLPVPEPWLAHIAYSVLQALNFTHVQMDRVHRDVKPSNIVLSDASGSTISVKLADFGSAVDATAAVPCATAAVGSGGVAFVSGGGHVSCRAAASGNMPLQSSALSTDAVGNCGGDDDDMLLLSPTGSRRYMAPERLAMEGYSFNSDVWSMGITLATVANGGVCPLPPETNEFNQLGMALVANAIICGASAPPPPPPPPESVTAHHTIAHNGGEGPMTPANTLGGGGAAPPQQLPLSALLQRRLSAAAAAAALALTEAHARELAAATPPQQLPLSALLQQRLSAAAALAAAALALTEAHTLAAAAAAATTAAAVLTDAHELAAAAAAAAAAALALTEAHAHELAAAAAAAAAMALALTEAHAHELAAAAAAAALALTEARTLAAAAATAATAAAALTEARELAAAAAAAGDAQDGVYCAAGIAAARAHMRFAPSPAFRDFLRCCLVPEARARPSARALLAHPFLAQRTDWERRCPEVLAAASAHRRTANQRGAAAGLTVTAIAAARQDGGSGGVLAAVTKAAPGMAALARELGVSEPQLVGRLSSAAHEVLGHRTETPLQGMWVGPSPCW